MQYIEAPQIYDGDETSLFLAGGITDCPDWQQEMVTALSATSLVLLNPRRANFPIHDPSAAKKQITWEYNHLRKASAISFWFPKETLCPIVLYELGAWSISNKIIFVGVEPGYQRAQDVQIQTVLVRPGVRIASTIAELTKWIAVWSAGNA